jgi:hypothetical protein
MSSVLSWHDRNTLVRKAPFCAQLRRPVEVKLSPTRLKMQKQLTFAPA